jgi:hypothetical protein
MKPILRASLTSISAFVRAPFLAARIATVVAPALAAGLAVAFVADFAAARRAAPLAATPVTRQSGTSGRDQSALAEDQALLMRQLQRLRQTMEVLAQRFETEGRTHAAKLLRDGLAHLGARATDAGSKTLEELMTSAHQDLESGQHNQAFETQQAAIKSLERLYSILTDRQGLENLEKSLDDLKKIQAELKELADRESALRTDTQSLDQKAENAGQRELASGIQKAIEEQRQLLSRTETESRASGSLDLESLERALDELIQRQHTDQSVLESWNPAEKSALEEASPALDQASEHAARAQRLAEAATALRAAAKAARADDADLPSIAHNLENSAEAEERHERASHDPAATKSAEALRAGAEDAKKSDPSATGRNRTAESLESRAAELAREAESENEANQEAARAALSTLEKLKDEKSAAGRVAEDVRQALAGKASGKSSEPGEKKAADEDVEKRAADAERRTSDAKRALDAGLDDLRTLKKALAASQSAAAEESERLSKNLGGLPQSESPEGKHAQSELESAGSEQKNASESSSREQPQEAARAAQNAEKALRAARDEIERLRSKGSAEKAKTQESEALEKAEQALAAKMDELKKAADASSLAPASKDGARSALSRAQSAMQKAAQGLDQGKSSEAAKSQSSALEELQKAAEAARSGTALEKPEDKDRAKELAEEQAKIKQQLLELAQRNQKRDAAQPNQNLDKAGESAQSAQQSLSQGDLGEAQSSEEETEKRMRQAMKELGQEEEQYQKLRQEELLFKIAEQVKSLIEEHQQQMKATLEVDAGRKPGETANHTQRLRLRKIAKAEEALGNRAGEISKAILAEESVVFAEVLDQADHDLKRLGHDMGEAGDYQSGERMQALQQDVEQGLSWLAEALQQEKERRKQEQQQSSQPNNQQQAQNRLVPDVAELKLLRRLEVDTGDNLERLQTLHPELKGGGDIDPLVLEDLRRFAYRHQRTTELFQKFRKRLGLPDPNQQD